MKVLELIATVLTLTGVTLLATQHLEWGWYVMVYASTCWLFWSAGLKSTWACFNHMTLVIINTVGYINVVGG